ncbi:MAG: alanine racemase [Candidatus Woykebacteria bacterium]
MAIERLAWCKISKKAIEHNIGQIQKFVGKDVGIMAVVKGNAYGHGAIEVSKIALESGVKCLGVSSFYEAKRLRESGIKDQIVILGFTPTENYYDMVENDITVTIRSLDVAHSLVTAARRLNKIARVWIKVNTGLNRLGLKPGEVLFFAKKLQDLPNLEVEGIFTHFAGDDEDTEATFTKQQLHVFNKVLDELKKEKIEISIKSAANTAAIFSVPESHFDMVRAGIGLWGFDTSGLGKVRLEKALTFKTEIVQITEIQVGETVGYSRTFKATRPTTVATIAVGYADGFRRAPKNWGEVLIAGQKAPLVGRVSMDQAAVDITDLEGDIRRGVEVILVGKSRDLELSADDVAEKLGTSPYEVLTSISARVSRFYV